MRWLCVLCLFFSFFSHSVKASADEELGPLSRLGCQEKIWLHNAIRLQEALRMAYEDQKCYWLSLFYLMGSPKPFTCYQSRWTPSLRALACHRLRRCQTILSTINKEVEHKKRLLKVLDTELTIAEVKLSSL